MENSMDGNVIFHFKKGRLDKERQYHIKQSVAFNLEPRNSLVAFITRVRKSLRDLTTGFPENFVTVNLDEADLEDIEKKEMVITTEIANGFLSTYNAICNLKQTKPSRYLISLISSLDSSCSKELDLSLWPGLVDDSEHLQILGLSLQFNTYFESLLIRNVLCPNVSKFISGIVKHNHRLKKIVIHNNGASFAHEIGGSLALNENNKISILDLSSNEIKQNGVTFIANALSKLNHTLKVLNLSNSKIGPEGFVHLFDALTANLGLSLSLCEFNISRNTMDEKSGDSFFKWLKEISSRTPELARLSVAKLGLPIGKIVKVVKKLPNIQFLNLSGNKHDGKAEHELISLGKSAKALKVLRLKNCSIPADVLKHSMESLFSNPQISGLNLDISKNVVGEKSEMIASALAKAKNLEVIDLSSMEIGMKGGINLFESVPVGLTKMIVDDNFSIDEVKMEKEKPDGPQDRLPIPPLVTTFFKTLQKMFENRTTISSFSMRGSSTNWLGHFLMPFFRILKTNSSLLYLDVSDQQCGPHAFQKLCRCLMDNTTLISVKAEGNNLSFKSFLQARNAIMESNSLMYFGVFSPTFDTGMQQPLTKDVLMDILSFNSLRDIKMKKKSQISTNLFKFSLNWEVPSFLATMVQIPENDDPKKKSIFGRTRSRNALNRKSSLSDSLATPLPLTFTNSSIKLTTNERSTNDRSTNDKMTRSKSQSAVNMEKALSKKVSDPSKPKRKKSNADEEDKKKSLTRKKRSEEVQFTGGLATIEDTPVKQVIDKPITEIDALPPPYDCPPPPFDCPPPPVFHCPLPVLHCPPVLPCLPPVLPKSELVETIPVSSQLDPIETEVMNLTSNEPNKIECELPNDVTLESRRVSNLISEVEYQNFMGSFQKEQLSDNSIDTITSQKNTENILCLTNEYEVAPCFGTETISDSSIFQVEEKPNLELNVFPLEIDLALPLSDGIDPSPLGSDLSRVHSSEELSPNSECVSTHTSGPISFHRLINAASRSVSVSISGQTCQPQIPSPDSLEEKEQTLTRRRSLPNLRAAIERRPNINTQETGVMENTEITPNGPLPTSSHVLESSPSRDLNHAKPSSLLAPTILSHIQSNTNVSLDLSVIHNRPSHFGTAIQQAQTARPILKEPVSVYRMTTTGTLPYPALTSGRLLHRAETQTVAFLNTPELAKPETSALLNSTNAHSGKPVRKTLQPTLSEKPKKVSKENNQPSDDLDAYLHNLELQQFSTQRNHLRGAWG